MSLVTRAVSVNLERKPSMARPSPPPPPASVPNADNIMAIFLFWLVALLLLFAGCLYLTLEAVARYYYGIPSTHVWTPFWGHPYQGETPFDWISIAHYHLQNLTSWTWIRQYWTGPIWSAVVISTLPSLTLTYFLLRWAFRSPSPKARDLTRKSASQDLIQRGVSKKQGIFAGRYHGQDFYVRLEDRGLVIGPSRTGKTAFLVNQILKASQNRLSFVAIDIKPELADILRSDLKAAGYRLICFNPLAENTEHYNPLEDIHSETAIHELVINLLPYLDSRDKPFTDAKRDYLRSALLHLQSAGHASLPLAYDLLTRYAQVEDYLQVLSRSPSPTAQAIGRRLTAGKAADPLVGLGFASVGRDIDYLAYASIKDALAYSDFSLAELGQTRPIALFIQFQETQLETLGAVLSALYGHILNCLIDNHPQRQAVALFYDEIGNVPPIEGLTNKLNTLASRQLPTWTYWQTTSQMRRKYGPHAEDLFFASADLQLFFRTQDAGTQALVSRLVGTTREWHATRTTSQHGISQTQSTQRVNVIEPHELGELGSGEVIALYRGGKARGWAPPYYQDYPQYLDATRRL